MRISPELKNTQHEHHLFRLRLGVSAVLVLICFGILTGRFFYLQFLKYDYYQTLAESNRISLVPIVPNRGLIDNLPQGCCVEVPVLVDKNGLLPTVLPESVNVFPARSKARATRPRCARAPRSSRRKASAGEAAATTARAPAAAAGRSGRRTARLPETDGAYRKSPRQGRTAANDRSRRSAGRRQRPATMFRHGIR